MVLEALEERRIIMNLLINLYNFQCSTIGHNQILSTFMKTPPASIEVPYEKEDLVAGYFEVGRQISPDGNGVFPR